MGLIENLETDIRRLYTRIEAIEVSRSNFMNNNWPELRDRVRALESRAREDAGGGEGECEHEWGDLGGARGWLTCMKCEVSQYFEEVEVVRVAGVDYSPAQPEPRNSVVLDELRRDEWSAHSARSNWCGACGAGRAKGHANDCTRDAAIREAGG